MGSISLIALLVGGSILVALAGSVLADPFWMALFPATLFMIPAVRLLRASHGTVSAPEALGGTILQASSAALLVLAALGALADVRFGIEPGWLHVLVMWSGIAFLVGAFLFGVGIFRAAALPRPTGLIFALSLPLGLGLDFVSGLVPGFFLSGVGFYLGMSLFALAIIMLGSAATRTARRS